VNQSDHTFDWFLNGCASLTYLRAAKVARTVQVATEVHYEVIVKF
jgi:hypothetical protein